MASSRSDKNKLEWTQIIISAFITAILSLIASLSFWYFTKEKPELTFEVFPISSFYSKKTELSILNVKIENEGSKEAENVVCVYHFPKDSEIMEINIEPSSNAIKYISEKINEVYKRAYSVPMLNPQEYLKFSFLVKNIKNSNDIEIGLRGKGVVGNTKQVTKIKKSNIEENFIVMATLIIIMTIMMFSLLLMIRRRSFVPMVSEKKEADDLVSTGVQYCDVGLFEDAVRIFKKSIYLNPDTPYAHSNLARAYANLNQFDKAYKALEIAEKLCENDDEQMKLIYHYTSAQVFSLDQNKDKAIEMLKLAMGININRCIEKAKVDEDFSNIRNTEEFEELIYGTKDI